MKKEQRMAAEILEQAGGKGNLQRIAHCMTRLRLSLKDDSKADLAGLKQIDGVMGVVEDETLQIVIGPGTVNKVAAEMSQLTGFGIGEDANADDLTFEEKAALDKQNMKAKNRTPLKTFYVSLEIFLYL